MRSKSGAQRKTGREGKPRKAGDALTCYCTLSIMKVVIEFPLRVTLKFLPSAVISGSSVHNFKDIYAIIEKAKAGFVVKTEDELFNIADKLFSDSAFYQTTAEAGKKVFEEQQGALEFVLNVLKQET